MARALIADDDEDIRFVLKSVLSERYEVEDVCNVHEALQALQDGAYDLVVTDLHMPGGSGFDVVRAAKLRDELLPVIIVTGSGTIDTALEALRSGAYDYILKPFEDLDVIRHAAHRAAEVRRYRHENRRLMDDLVRETRRVENELRMAQRVQRSMLPSPPSVPGLKAYGRLQAARQVGGDFYDFFSDHGTMGFVMGDVVGKGVPAALLMMLAITASREITRTMAPPAELLESLNRRLREYLRQAEEQDVLATVSMVALHLDVARREMIYAKAGHEEVLWWHAAERGVESLKARGVFLGAFDHVDYEQCAITLAPGDRLFVYTDGLTEMRNGEGDLFTVERLRAAIEAGAEDDLEAHGERVLAAADAFRGGADLSDDLALVIFEVA